jgi:hypothetical protein
MELILALIVLIIVWCIAFIAGNKHMINKIKKDGGYFDTEITGAVYPYRTSSVNNDTMEFNPPHFKDIPKWTPPSLVNDDTMGTIGSKPKTQTDYQNEHKIPPCVGHELQSQKEIEKRDIDFMYKWIREKSGKK